MPKIQAIVLAFLMILIYPVGISQGCWVAVPLVDRLEKAELVVVGTLAEVQEKYYGVTWFHDDPDGVLKQYTDLYDIGRIRIEKVFKGTWHEGSAGFSFHHPNQEGNPFKHMKYSYKENQRGIWLLNRERYGGFYQVTRPDNYLPMDRLDEVEAAMKELESKEKKRYRVTVQRDGDRYRSFIEGSESWDASSGRTPKEAFGATVMKHPEIFGVDVEVIEQYEESE